VTDRIALAFSGGGRSSGRHGVVALGLSQPHDLDRTQRRALRARGVA